MRTRREELGGRAGVPENRLDPQKRGARVTLTWQGDRLRFSVPWGRGQGARKERGLAGDFSAFIQTDPTGTVGTAQRLHGEREGFDGSVAAGVSEAERETGRRRGGELAQT